VGVGVRVVPIVIEVPVVVLGILWGVVSAIAGGAHETLFDESQERGVIADGVRDVVPLGEGRDGDEGNADSATESGQASSGIRQPTSFSDLANPSASLSSGCRCAALGPSPGRA